MAEQSRLEDEHERVRALERASRGAVSVIQQSPDLQQYVIGLRVAAPVTAGTTYRVEEHHRLTITLPDGFPDEKPLAVLDHAIFVPNVYPNAIPCILEAWRAGQHLDALITGIIEEIQGLAPNIPRAANEAAALKFKDPAFVGELRRRLGPPLRLAPPAVDRSMSRTPSAAIRPASTPPSGPAGGAQRRPLIRRTATRGVPIARAAR